MRLPASLRRLVSTSMTAAASVFQPIHFPRWTATVLQAPIRAASGSSQSSSRMMALLYGMVTLKPINPIWRAKVRKSSRRWVSQGR